MTHSSPMERILRNNYIVIVIIKCRRRRYCARTMSFLPRVFGGGGCVLERSYERVSRATRTRISEFFLCFFSNLLIYISVFDHNILFNTFKSLLFFLFVFKGLVSIAIIMVVSDKIAESSGGGHLEIF